MDKKTISVNDLPIFDPAEYLRDEKDIAAYLSEVLEENDLEELVRALGTVARARGMTQIARESGLAREALYRALRPGAHPRFETIARVIKAMGMHLAIEPSETKNSTA